MNRPPHDTIEFNYSETEIDSIIKDLTEEYFKYYDDYVRNAITIATREDFPQELNFND